MTEGFGRLTVETVSARSRVGKPTIYRYWANASEIAMAALMADGSFDDLEMGRLLYSALQAQLRSLVAAFATTRRRQVALTLAAADPESEMAKALRNSVMLSSRETGRRLILAAQAHGEIEDPTNIEVVSDMIYAPVFFRLLVGHLRLDAGFSGRLTDEARKLIPLKVTGSPTLSTAADGHSGF